MEKSGMKINNARDDISVAYFSLEIGIESSIPTYSGGLGVLAGDTLRSFVDVKVPAIGVSLLYKKGYFCQRIINGQQHEEEVRWNPTDYMKLLPEKVSVKIDNRIVAFQAWQYSINGEGRTIPVIFLDTDLPENSDYDRTITHTLYGNDQYYRVAQEMVLGIGGVRMLEALHIAPHRYHMNEGHAGFLTLELLLRTKKRLEQVWDESSVWDKEEVRERCVFTTHTPVDAGHDKFPYDLIARIMGDTIPLTVVQEFGGHDHLNMTLLALNLSNYVNGVAKKHGEVSKQMFPGYNIESITNGIHSGFWASKHIAALYDTYIPGWRLDPFSLRSALNIPNSEIEAVHAQAKKDLLAEVRKRTGIQFDKNTFTLGYARRFTAYKRPDLLFHDVEELKKVADQAGSIQIIFAGKAHPHDQYGKELIAKVIRTASELDKSSAKVKAVFLENYDIDLAKYMVAGCDVWLNNPRRPQEASGTSGMKAAVNGVPHLSTLDGWWLEGHIENVTGWSIGPSPREPGFESDYSGDDEAKDLYRMLRQNILPCFYNERDKWISITKHTIAINGSFFNTNRMVQEYVAKSYF
jgi:starch phosphorylase